LTIGDITKSEDRRRIARVWRTNRAQEIHAMRIDRDHFCAVRRNFFAQCVQRTSTMSPE